MGMFLSASGVIGADRSSIEKSITSFANAHEGTFEHRPGATDTDKVAVISENGSNCTIMYPRDFMFWDDLSRHLSRELQKPVFSFHIHDGDLWMFIFFDKGAEVSQFNPIPDYWEELDPNERSRWAADADTICHSLPGTSVEAIRKYFVEWTEDVASSGQKAYPDDQFPYGSDWQMTDFMRRVGLTFPIREDGTIDGNTYRLRVRRLRASN